MPFWLLPSDYMQIVYLCHMINVNLAKDDILSLYKINPVPWLFPRFVSHFV